MKLSEFGRRLTGESGTRLLMDDLGEAVSAGGGIVNLGGGNPSHIPAAEGVFRARMQAFMQRPGALSTGDVLVAPRIKLNADSGNRHS